MGAAARRRLAIPDHWRTEATLAGFRPLARLLARTGGAPLWLTSHGPALSPSLRGLLAKAASLAGSHHLLGCPFTLAAFTPHGHELGDGRLVLAPGYHRTRVRVARRGVQVLTRRGVPIAAPSRENGLMRGRAAGAPPEP